MSELKGPQELLGPSFGFFCLGQTCEPVVFCILEFVEEVSKGPAKGGPRRTEPHNGVLGLIVFDGETGNR